MNQPIATLDLPEYKIKELHSKGYIYCEDVNIENLQSDIGISAEEWKELTKSTETKSALDLCEDDAVSSHIVTFCSNLDEVLGGGIPVKMITEINGLPGTGKTQLCLQLCVSVQLSDCFGGLNGNAVYIDTNFGFTPHRLSDMIKSCIKYCQEVANTYNSFEMLEVLKNVSEETFLKGVHYIQATKFVELLSVINSLKKFLLKNSNIKLVVIDSITYATKNTDIEYFERIKLIYTFLAELQKLANIYKFAIVLTNDITTKFDANGTSYETQCLGDSFAHRMNCRIMLKRVTDIVFEAKVLKNILKPNSVVKFQINEAGIRDTQ